jgi:hypothetical protein
MNSTPFRLESPSAAIAAVPYLLGYEPEHCIVAIHLVDNEIGMTMRMSLAHDASVTEWAHELVAYSAHVCADSVVVICFPDADRAACDRALDAVRAAYDECGIFVRDALMVLRPRSQRSRSQVRWRSLMCADVRCCSRRGTPLVEAEADRARAFFILHGRAPLSSREQLVAELHPYPTDRVGAIADLVAAAERTLQTRLGECPSNKALDAWREEAITRLAVMLGISDSAPSQWADTEIAMALISLLDARVRDTLIWEFAQIPRQNLWEPVCALLTEAVRCSPDGCIAPVATLLAQLRWSYGDGARAGIALDLALLDDPDYVMAKLMRHAISTGIPPKSWLETLRARPREEFRYGVDHLRRAS